VDYHCAWDQGKHLWMVYLMRVIGAQTVLDKPGSVVLWTNCRHPFYDHNPYPQAAPPQRPVWVGDFGTCSAPGTPWSCRIPPPQRPARHPRLDEMSLPMNTPTVSLIDVSTYLPENRVPAEWYAGHAGADNLRDNPMFAPPAYRHHAAFDESNVDMIERASAGLVARHGPEVLEDVDVLLTHSEMPDLPIVGAGGELAHRLGMTPQWILDVHNSGCAAFVSMLKLAQKLLASGAGRTALIAAAANAAGRVFEQEQVRKLAQSLVPGDGAAVGLLTLSVTSPVLDIECRFYGQNAGGHDPGRRPATPMVAGRPRRRLRRLQRGQDHESARPRQPSGARGRSRGMRPHRGETRRPRPACHQPAQPVAPAQLARGARDSPRTPPRHVRGVRQPVRRRHTGQPGGRDQ
jgi:hypothetical protein